MSVLCGAQCRVNTCGKQQDDGKIPLGNKICWLFEEPTGLQCIFSDLHVPLHKGSNCSIPYLHLLFSITFSHSDYVSVFLLLHFPCHVHMPVILIQFSLSSSFQSLAVYVFGDISNSPNLLHLVLLSLCLTFFPKQTFR